MRWTGELKVAEICFASQTNVDVFIDHFSLIKLSETELATATLVDRAALEGFTEVDYGDDGQQAPKVLDERPTVSCSCGTPCSRKANRGMTKHRTHLSTIASRAPGASTIGHEARSASG
jgi:hypothetical protein